MLNVADCDPAFASTLSGTLNAALFEVIAIETADGTGALNDAVQAAVEPDARVTGLHATAVTETFCGRNVAVLPELIKMLSPSAEEPNAFATRTTVLLTEGASVKFAIATSPFGMVVRLRACAIHFHDPDAGAQDRLLPVEANDDPAVIVTDAISDGV